MSVKLAVLFAQPCPCSARICVELHGTHTVGATVVGACEGWGVGFLVTVGSGDGTGETVGMGLVLGCCEIVGTSDG